MTNLDKQLRKILDKKFPDKAWAQWRNIGVTKNGHLRPKLGSHYSEQDEFIAQIKQAFLEDDWKKLPSGYVCGSHHWINGEHKVPLMTGQEWYERFEKIVLDNNDPLWQRPMKPSTDMAIEIQNRVLEAAKIAAGVEDASR